MFIHSQFDLIFHMYRTAIHFHWRPSWLRRWNLGNLYIQLWLMSQWVLCLLGHKCIRHSNLVLFRLSCVFCTMDFPLRIKSSAFFSEIPSQIWWVIYTVYCIPVYYILYAVYSILYTCYCIPEYYVLYTICCQYLYTTYVLYTMLYTIYCMLYTVYCIPVYSRVYILYTCLLYTSPSPRD